MAATTVFTDAQTAPSVISFHGYGPTATRSRIRYVLDHLAAHGVSSTCFDFSGNGESTGNLEQSCLRLREEEACAATRAMGLQAHPTFIGTSMGGFLAALLAPVFKPRSIILFCPSAYLADAMDVPFDEKFLGIARHPDVYKLSPAFTALRDFRGDLLIFTAGNDVTVPREVIQSYAHSAPEAKSVKVVRIEESDHKIHPWLALHEYEMSRVLGEIMSVV